MKIPLTNSDWFPWPIGTHWCWVETVGFTYVALVWLVLIVLIVLGF